MENAITGIYIGRYYRASLQTRPKQRQKISVGRSGLPISRALGFSDAGDEMDLRNLFFVIRDAMKFLHQQAGRIR